MKLRGFIGQSYQSRNPQFDCSRTVNLYPVPDENQTGSNQQIASLLSSPGLTNVLSQAVGGTSVRGVYISTQGQFFFVAGSTLYVLSGAFAPYAPVVVGTLLTSVGRVRFADNGTQLVVVDGPFGYYMNNMFSNKLTQITDPAFYGSKFVDYYDGYFIFAKPGTGLFYWTNVNSVTFNALNFATKSGDADDIAGFFVMQRQLWLIGTQTTEIWYDIGGTVTFQRLQGPYSEFGCGAPDTICMSEAGGFWLAQSPRGGSVVLQAIGNSPQRVSNFGVDFALQQYGANIAASTGLVYQYDGSLIYQINPGGSLGVANSSWCYDSTVSQFLGQSTWHEKSYTVQPFEASVTQPNGSEQRHKADCAAFYNGQVLVGDYSSSNLYAFDDSNYTDNGAYITRTRIAPHINNELNRIFYSRFRLMCQSGTGGLANVTTYTTVNGNANINLTMTSSVTPGGCTFYGFASNADLAGSTFGTLVPSTFSNVTVLGLIATATNLGANSSQIDLYLSNNSVAPDVNAFNYLTFVDAYGNTHLYLANQSGITPNFPDPKITDYNWNSLQTKYNIFLYPNTNPWVGNVVVNYNTSVTTQNTSIVAVTPTVLLSWSDDGGFIWSPETALSIGQVGQYKHFAEAWQLGEGRNRAFRVRCTDPVAFNLYDASIEIITTNI